jgi:hypothetical protein
MKAFIYAADLYCEDCGRQIRKELTAKGDAPANPADEHTYDSDYFPKGPFDDGGGESDTIHHCAGGEDCPNAVEIDGTKHGCLLENPLTSDGLKYLKSCIDEDGDSPVVKFWAVEYRKMGYDVPMPEDGE